MSFAEMIWLMLRGNKPTKGQADLLEAALVASVDHGPQAPSIAAARMAVTCGLGLNGAMGTLYICLMMSMAVQVTIFILCDLTTEPNLNIDKIANYLTRYSRILTLIFLGLAIGFISL